MEIKFTIPDAKASVLVDALCKAYDYQEFVLDEDGRPTEVSNPETRVAFVKRMTVEFWKNHVEAYELDNARKEAEENITITDLTVT